MTEIRLQRLTLCKFKGIDALTLDFNGQSAALYGDNAAGKTTIYDAYLWLLTGKDSLGRGDFEIKPLDGHGNVADHAARSSVEGVLTVEGKTVTLRREFYELWSKKRGRTEATYDGNTTDYYINDVPKSKRAYEDALGELVPMDKLRLLSDTAAFAALPWKGRRELLFDLAELGSDMELMRENPRFQPLVEEVGNDALEDVRAKWKARRKKVNARLNDLPLLIGENRKTEGELGDIPADRLAAELADLEEDEHRLTADIAAIESGKEDDLREKRIQTKAALDALERENALYRREQQLRAPDSSALERAVTEAQKRLAEGKRRYAGLSDSYHEMIKVAEMHEDNAGDYRAQWAEKKGEQFAGDTTCPTCGQKLPAEQLDAARTAWEKEKQDRLRTIQGLGSGAASRGRQARQRAEELQQSMIDAEGEIARATEELAGAEEALAAFAAPEILNLEGYARRKKELEEEIRTLEEDWITREQTYQDQCYRLRLRRQDVRTKKRELSALLGKAASLESVRWRIGELEQERTALAGELAALDRLTDLADEFVRYKGQYVTDAVNGRFRIARFRLFAEQVNGETPPACDILCGGVPYEGGLNNSARINVGLDILRTLSRHYGCSLPVFVDNAESVVHLEPVDTQIIRLVVSEEDRKVRMEI